MRFTMIRAIILSVAIAATVTAVAYLSYDRSEVALVLKTPGAPAEVIHSGISRSSCHAEIDRIKDEGVLRALDSYTLLCESQ
jgi:hypothetical protein